MSAAATMTGMSRASGRSLGGDNHLRQSIADILSTPIGTRVMRRDYGSLLFELLDQPVNARTRIRLFAAVAIALQRWEPRLRIVRLVINQLEPGHLDLTLEGRRTDTGPTSGSAGGSAALTRLTLPIRTGASPVLA